MEDEDIINDSSISDFSDDEIEYNIYSLMSQVRLVEIKIKYNDFKLELYDKNQITKKKISNIIDIYDILISKLKEKHIITKILDFKYEMEIVEYRNKCEDIKKKFLEEENKFNTNIS